MAALVRDYILQDRRAAGQHGEYMPAPGSDSVLHILTGAVTVFYAAASDTNPQVAQTTAVVLPNAAGNGGVEGNLSERAEGPKTWSAGDIAGSSVAAAAPTQVSMEPQQDGGLRGSLGQLVFVDLGGSSLLSITGLCCVSRP